MNKVESALSRTTDTKALVIGTDTLPQVADMFRKLFPDKRALVVADANTWRVAGDDVHKILAGAGVAQDEPYVFTTRNSMPNGRMSGSWIPCLPRPMPCP